MFDVLFGFETVENFLTMPVMVSAVTTHYIFRLPFSRYLMLLMPEPPIHVISVFLLP